MNRGKPLARRKGLERGIGLAQGQPLRPGGQLQRTSRISPVSDRRRAENRERSAMANRLWPDRRDGTVMCAVPGCWDRAEDLHEVLPRGRGGSITDPDNAIPTCRRHNGEIADSPEWAYRLGVLKHDGLCCQGRAVCERYAAGSGEAA